jgi:hypothetical protein
MAQNSTQHTLLLHLFNELRPAEANAFEHLLISDPEMQQEYRETADLVAAFTAEVLPEPDPVRLKQLLDYASR